MDTTNRINLEIRTDSESNQVFDNIQSICSFLEKRAEKNKPVRPEQISGFAIWFLRMLSQECPAPPALERMFLSADSYLSRENLLINGSKIVISSIFSFAHYLFKSAALERQERAEAEKTLHERIEEDGELLMLGRDPRLVRILQELMQHDKYSLALNEKELTQKSSFNHTSQMSKYLKEREKYDLWYWLKDGQSKRYFITEKGRQVLKIIQDSKNHGSVQGQDDSVQISYPAKELVRRNLFMMYLISALCDVYEPEWLIDKCSRLLAYKGWNQIEKELMQIMEDDFTRKKVQDWFQEFATRMKMKRYYSNSEEKKMADTNPRNNLIGIQHTKEEWNLKIDDRVFREFDLEREISF